MSFSIRSRRPALLAVLGALVLALAVLGVRAAAASAAGPTLTWLGNEEVQSQPPFGGSNYLSAGPSDGTQATYKAADGDVRVVQLVGGAEQTPTWATRTAHIAGTNEQRGLFDDGAVTQSGGSTVVQWTGELSVNFYGGLVPFTIKDPKLTVAGDGTGTLEATLYGWAASMENPTVKEPLPEVPGVEVATFRNVTFDAAGFTVEPDYAGVEVETGTSTPQNRTNAGWGAWPQSFVDFQLDSGLSSYWYTSGGAADVKKPPLPFTVGPTTTQPGGPGTPDPGTPEPGTPNPGTPDQGTPNPGTPDQGTPNPGTSDQGTPNPGTPDQGTTPAGPSPAAATAPSVALPKQRTRTLDAKRRLAVATITCAKGGPACRIVAPKSVKVTIGGKRYTARVVASRSVRPGKQAAVRLQLTKAAANRLKGRTLKASVKLRITAGKATVSRTVKVTGTAKAAKAKTR